MQVYKGKKRRVVVPEHLHEEVKQIGKAFSVSIPRAFMIREDIIGELIKTKRVRGKKRFMIEIKNL